MPWYNIKRGYFLITIDCSTSKCGKRKWEERIVFSFDVKTLHTFTTLYYLSRVSLFIHFWIRYIFLYIFSIWNDSQYLWQKPISYFVVRKINNSNIKAIFYPMLGCLNINYLFCHDCHKFYFCFSFVSVLCSLFFFVNFPHW